SLSFVARGPPRALLSFPTRRSSDLTAIFVAGAAGLRIFWAWVAPGQRRRLTALTEEARSLITVALGLVVVLLISGIVEGFVTPADRKSTRLNSSHVSISYAVFCLKK